MPALIVDTPEGIRLSTEIAGVGSRLAAAVLDGILIVAGYIALLLALAFFGWILDASGVILIEEAGDFVLGFVGGGFILIFLGYLFVCPLLMNGRTPGKRSAKIHVVSADGYPASPGQHLLRALLFPVEILPLPAPLGLILIAVTPSHQRLGDLAASTVVLCEPVQKSGGEPWPEERWSDRPEKHLDLTPGMAARLAESDLSFLREAILRREIPRERRDLLYRRIVAYYADRLGFQATEKTRLCLKELYLFGRESRRA